MDRSYKQTKKREKYYSEVTLVLLHYSEHIEDTHFMWTWSHRPFHPSQTDWTGSNCYAQPRRLCRCLEPFRVCVVKEVCLTRVGLSHRPTYKFLFPFCVLLLLNIKPTIHMPVPSGLTGLEHSTY